MIRRLLNVLAGLSLVLCAVSVAAFGLTFTSWGLATLPLIYPRHGVGWPELMIGFMILATLFLAIAEVLKPKEKPQGFLVVQKTADSAEIPN